MKLVFKASVIALAASVQAVKIEDRLPGVFVEPASGNILRMADCSEGTKCWYYTHQKSNIELTKKALAAEAEGKKTAYQVRLAATQADLEAKAAARAAVAKAALDKATAAKAALDNAAAVKAAAVKAALDKAADLLAFKAKALASDKAAKGTNYEWTIQQANAKAVLAKEAQSTVTLAKAQSYGYTSVQAMEAAYANKANYYQAEAAAYSARAQGQYTLFNAWEEKECEGAKYRARNGKSCVRADARIAALVKAAATKAAAAKAAAAKAAIAKIAQQAAYEKATIETAQQAAAAKAAAAKAAVATKPATTNPAYAKAAQQAACGKGTNCWNFRNYSPKDCAQGTKCYYYTNQGVIAKAAADPTNAAYTGPGTAAYTAKTAAIAKAAAEKAAAVKAAAARAAGGFGCTMCSCSRVNGALSAYSGGVGDIYTNCKTGWNIYGPFMCYLTTSTKGVYTFRGHGNCPSNA